VEYPDGFENKGNCLLLKRALYGLRISPLLWQQELCKVLKELGLSEILQEPCLFQNHYVILFYYVDDIVLLYREEHAAKVEELIKKLTQRFPMTDLGELEWFLGIRVINGDDGVIYLSQREYIKQLINTFKVDLSKQFQTPLSTAPLTPYQGVATREEATLYQRKTGSILYATINTRPDAAFAASRLCQFNKNPGPEHHKEADRTMAYLYQNDLSLAFGITESPRESVPKEQHLTISSDASFADNSEDRKSSQGFIMKLFGGPITWKASKQPTVTTSSTEAELLALSHVAKEAIYIGRLFKDIRLDLEEQLMIECDNQQTIRLLQEQNLRLTTRLRHVDIHHHWLRQEAGKAVHFRWVTSKDTIADGLTKALSVDGHLAFIRLLGLQKLNILN